MSTVTIPTLTTERLVLRAPELSDLDAYAAFYASERSHIIGGPYSREKCYQRLAALCGQWHLRGYGRWMITDRVTGEALGVTGPLHPIEWPEPEIAWSVFANAEGRGIAFEAASAARAYVYDTLGWTTVISTIPPGNTRSIALAKRMGATQEPSFHHPEYGELLVWRHPSPEAMA